MTKGGYIIVCDVKIFSRFGVQFMVLTNIGQTVDCEIFRERGEMF